MTVRERARDMLSPCDVARLLHLHINTVRRWSNRGIIKTQRVGIRGDRVYSWEDIARFVEKLEKNDLLPKNELKL